MVGYPPQGTLQTGVSSINDLTDDVTVSGLGIIITVENGQVIELSLPDWFDQAVKQASSPTLAGLTLTGDLDIGANLFKTTNLLLREEDTEFWAVRNAANTLYKSIVVQYYKFGFNSGEFQSQDIDDYLYKFMARDNGVGLVEVARVQGAVDPYFQITRSLMVVERAAAQDDVATKGQFWVKDDAPNVAFYTDDAGTDQELKTQYETTPAQITGNVNNYAIGSFSFVRLSTDGVYNITGIVAGYAGHTLTLVNISSDALTLTDQDANSDAANRFQSANGGNIELAQDEMAWCIYDATTARWRIAHL